MAKGFRSGTSTTNGLGLKMFQEDDLWNLHYATLDVLSKIGVKVESEKARDCLLYTSRPQLRVQGNNFASWILKAICLKQPKKARNPPPWTTTYR